MNILGIIPARAGSKGIKDKNMYLIRGIPLLKFTTRAAIESHIEACVITTDYDFESFDRIPVRKRPAHLATDDAKMIDVIKDLLSNDIYSWVDSIMLLQPTSPLRTEKDIDKAIKLFEESGANSLYSGYYMGVKHKDKVYDKHTSEKHFQRNGAIFIVKRELIEQGKLWDDTVIEYEMPLSRSIDIDIMDDMYIAEALLEKRLKEGVTP
jgi:CMP-N,N'-diacetyllegionaminic acid synthase